MFFCSFPSLLWLSIRLCSTYPPQFPIFPQMTSEIGMWQTWAPNRLGLSVEGGLQPCFWRKGIISATLTADDTFSKLESRPSLPFRDILSHTWWLENRNEGGREEKRKKYCDCTVVAPIMFLYGQVQLGVHKDMWCHSHDMSTTKGIVLVLYKYICIHRTPKTQRWRLNRYTTGLSRMR